MNTIDELLEQLKKIDTIEKAVKEQKAAARAKLEELVELLPDKAYENTIAKVTITNDVTTKRVNYDMLLGMIGDEKYNKVVTTSTRKGSVKTTWK